MKDKPKTGTREWSDSSVNCINGCQSDCLYCYGKSMAIRFGRATPESWKNEIIKDKGNNKKFGKRKGTVMFPTTHDINENNYDACYHVLASLIESDNDVLVVSKPDSNVIERLINALNSGLSFDSLWTTKVLFRFTIGSMNRWTLDFWEPNAPSFAERLYSLMYAYKKGCNTSVSMEPILDTDWMDVYKLIDTLLPYVTDSIWIGKPNKLIQRLKTNGCWNAATEHKARELIAVQSDENILKFYNSFKKNDKIKWKDSIKKVLQSY